MLAVLAAIAAVSRVPFASIPSVQPTTFVIIVTGIAFGAESGFVVGALAALVSNLFLGQGPWTPWQMYAWGMIGLSAGFLRHTWFMKRAFGRIIFGFITGILFGWVMNLWYFVSLGEHVKLAEIIAYFGASIYFDLAHALSNVFFITVFANSWVKILKRFRKKYGLLDG
jgi:energy-coupling factor transport system substrate-specific component